jgi:hypothetical protein
MVPSQTLQVILGKNDLCSVFSLLDDLKIADSNCTKEYVLRKKKRGKGL